MQPTPAATRHVIQQLVAGYPPDAPPAAFGAWGGLIEQLHRVLTDDGPAAAQDALAVAVRSDRGLAALMAGDTPPPALPVTPGLPGAVLDAIASAPTCGGWLDQYTRYASAASPVTPPAFHEAAGLFIVATTIARRLCVRMGSEEFYPNIYALFIAQPGRYAKSVALKVAKNVIRAAGLDYLLLPEKTTPESLFRQMSVYMPPDFDTYSAELQAAWLRQRAQASTRALLLDEAGYLFGDLKKDYMAAMLGMILELYDAPPKLRRDTISHGETVITDASFSFFGATTPKSMEAHLQSERLWDEGLWSRFALISPEHEPIYATFAESLYMPSQLISGLQAIDHMFDKPLARVVRKDDAGAVKQDYIEVTGGGCHVATFDPAARVLWTAYDKALRFDIPNQGLDETLYASYTRFPSQALKVAMLFAVMDDSDRRDGVVIGVPHLARAFRVVEGWRANLHRLWRDGMQTQETKTGHRIIGKLREAGEHGMTARELAQLVKGANTKEIKEMLELLRQAAQVELIETKATNGRAIQRWRTI